jgi:hypothetical protein
MALVLADRVKETASAPGTGAVTLLGASLGFQSFAVVGNGNTTYYTISDQGGPNWEVGIGTYSTTGPTLTRTVVLESSNGGSLTDFNAGSQDVFVTYPAEKAVYTNASNNVNPLGIISSATWNATAITPQYGGTGASTLTGYVYGNGTSTMTASTTIPTTALTGVLETTNGGTGLSTYTAGDIVYYSAGTALTKLGIGSNGQVLTSNGSAPVWGTVSSIAVTTFSAGTTGFTPSTATSGAVTLSGTLATTNGGTGLTGFTAANNAIYSTSSSALTAGTLPVAAGGTGITSLTLNRVPYGNGTSALQSSANLTFNGTTLTTTDITDSSLTAGRVTYAGVGGNLVDSSSLTFASSTLSAPQVNASNGIVVNSLTVSASYSIPSGSSAMSTGPVTVASGVTVTVPTGGKWIIL